MDRRNDQVVTVDVDTAELHCHSEPSTKLSAFELRVGEAQADERHLTAEVSFHTAASHGGVAAGPDRVSGSGCLFLNRGIANYLKAGNARRGRQGIGIVGPGVRDPAMAHPLGIRAEFEK